MVGVRESAAVFAGWKLLIAKLPCPTLKVTRLSPSPPHDKPTDRDSIKNQTYFSFEAFGDFLRQVSQRYTTPPGLESPSYTLLKRTADYQVRRYDPFLVAEAPLDGGSTTSSSGGDDGSSAEGEGGGSSGGSSSVGAVNPASAGVKAFGELAKYLFGGNAEGRKMKMTTPVLSSSGGTMQFVIGSGDAKVGRGRRLGCLRWGVFVATRPPTDRPPTDQLTDGPKHINQPPRTSPKPRPRRPAPPSPSPSSPPARRPPSFSTASRPRAACGKSSRRSGRHWSGTGWRRGRGTSWLGTTIQGSSRRSGGTRC
jgi:hypothetical protein